MRTARNIGGQIRVITAAGCFLLAASATTGCAASSSAAAKPNAAPSSSQTLSNANPQAPDAARCKDAVNDVTKFCKEGASNGKCDDAKARTRKFCMKTE